MKLLAYYSMGCVMLLAACTAQQQQLALTAGATAGCAAASVTYAQYKHKHPNSVRADAAFAAISAICANPPSDAETASVAIIAASRALVVATGAAP